MPGGLIQIATYGSQDLFLTGVPEITFFKVVYRRHTNFSMESVKVYFDDPVEFGSYSIVKIPKVGDLMHKTYVEIKLPKIELHKKHHANHKLHKMENLYIEAKNNYNITLEFMKINRLGYIAGYDKLIAENSVDDPTSDIIDSINNIFESYAETDTQFKNLISGTENVPFKYDEISMQSICNIENDNLFHALSIGVEKSIKVQGFFFNTMRKMHKKYEKLKNDSLKFAWVKRIGHAIIESVEVKIGGHKIDKNWGDWINIWYELTANRNMQEIYYRMIGNVPELTNFNKKKKPSYILRIPLQFWFCKFSGLSIPLVALEYHDVSLHFKFRKFEQLCYIEHGEIRTPCSDEGINLEEVPDNLSVNINAWLIIDYIYLDSSERKRFAQSSHEYLIEQLQRVEISNMSQSEMQVLINNFVHPSKELIWVSQKEKYMHNEDGHNECRWDNYSLNHSNYGNPIKFSSIFFNSYTRCIKLDGNYFNYVQPYESHYTTPSDGINMYSFSLFPEEVQPSGTANLSRISRIIIQMWFSHCTDPLNIRVYTRNLNILRIVSGFSGIAFCYG
jgi:hypothetical protein